MAEENPALGKSYVHGYSLENKDYPIIGVVWNPHMGGYTPSAMGTAHPDTTSYPTHKLTSITPTAADQRVLWLYEILPGPTLTSFNIDPESLALVTRDVIRVVGGSVTPGVAVGATLVITEEEAVTDYVSNKVITTIAAASNSSLATALESKRTMGYQFPARINLALLDDCPVLGFRQPSARLVEATVKTYWTISSSTPSITFDTIIPSTITVNDKEYQDVLHDAVTLNYTCGSGTVPVSWPATTPSATQYATSWIGQQKVIAAEVIPTKYKSFWRIELTFLTMR